MKSYIRVIALLMLGACSSYAEKIDAPIDLDAWIPHAGPEVAETGQGPTEMPQGEDATLPIDLATTLRLAGASAIEIELARARAREAAYVADAETARILPFLVAGGNFRARNGAEQESSGAFITVDKQSTFAGLGAEMVFDPETLYTSLAARQREKAAEHSLLATANTTLLRAAEAYFALVASESGIMIAEDAVAEAEELLAVETSRLEAGAGLPASVARARARLAETEGDLEASRSAAEIDSARLVETLRLAPGLRLVPRLEDASAPIEFIDVDESLQQTLDRALSARPELRSAEAELEATAAESDFTGTGWLIPELRAGAAYGGFGLNFGELDDQETYYVAALWKLDFGMGSRHAAALQRQDQARLDLSRLRDSVAASVVTARRRVLAGRARIDAATREVDAATENLQLVQSRQAAGADILLTVLDGQSTLTRARTALVTAVAEHNAAQYALLRAVGGSR